jgi:hypothetical protein
MPGFGTKCALFDAFRQGRCQVRTEVRLRTEGGFKCAVTAHLKELHAIFWALENQEEKHKTAAGK